MLNVINVWLYYVYKNIVTDSQLAGFQYALI